jgi:hypothetical protein
MKTINISLETAKEMLSSGVESLKKMAEETYPELVVPKQKKWGRFGKVEGFYIDSNCKITNYHPNVSYIGNRNTHPTQKEAESALALSELRQWRDQANGEKLCDWADWSNDTQHKYCIWRCLNTIESSGYHRETFNELSFKTPELRDQFLIDHLDLIKTYFMIE